jgi:hypothetical protein
LEKGVVKGRSWTFVERIKLPIFFAVVFFSFNYPLLPPPAIAASSLPLSEPFFSPYIRYSLLDRTN